MAEQPRLVVLENIPMQLLVIAIPLKFAVWFVLRLLECDWCAEAITSERGGQYISAATEQSAKQSVTQAASQGPAHPNTFAIRVDSH